MDIGGIIAIIAVFSTTYGVIHLLVRKKERLIMIEKGMTPAAARLPELKSLSMKFGLLLTAIGLGILIGNILVATTTLDGEVAYTSMIFLLAGIALLLDYFIEDRKKE